MTGLYAMMHLIVDLLCAWAMFRQFDSGNGIYYLIYNFCAFALQMPLGTFLDLLKERNPRSPRRWVMVGCAVTVAGAFVHPAVLGLGNALFHVGGGMEVIGADFARQRKGRDLGIFVAPGAIGLYIGTLLGHGNAGIPVLMVGAGILAVLGILLHGKTLPAMPVIQDEEEPRAPWLAALCCFAVVILRSCVGLSVSFSWKASLGWLAVLAVAAGKVSGGFLSARFGLGRTVILSLMLAAGCFLLGEIPAFGLLALLLFNMSMPVTLYLLAKKMPRMPGFAFGLLTFGLFLGFLPVYSGMSLPVSGGVLGAVGSVLSVVILGKAVGRDEISS